MAVILFHNDYKTWLLRSSMNGLSKPSVQDEARGTVMEMFTLTFPSFDFFFFFKSSCHVLTTTLFKIA